MNLETIVLKNNSLKILDQTLLPQKAEYVPLTSLDQVIEAIQSLRVRGAPAIGIVAAYGLFIYALNLQKEGRLQFKALLAAAQKLKEARPTAVNLAWAVERMVAVARQTKDAQQMLEALREEALSIHQEDRNTCAQIGRFGSDLVPDHCQILTHCNTGFLATGGIGTALGVVYTAAEQGKQIHVFVDETRPVGQGARLTYWELQQAGIPATLIADNMAGFLMKQGKVDLVITGADRIARNGDTANKIGTYSLAVLARHHGIPFYIAAPFSTFDASLNSGEQIPIEQRPASEILRFWNLPENGANPVYNPAFDVTPAELISGIITETGILTPPFEQKITKITKQFN